MRNLLSGLFRTAQNWGYVQQNPALGVLLPEVQTKEGRFLSRDEANRLLAELPEPSRTMVLLALVTGLRRGELFALRWKRVDLQRRVIYVRESVYEGHFGTPKTKSSIRDLPISPQAAAAIGELPRGNAGELVFPSRAGTALDPQHVVKRIIHPACDRAGVHHFGWKDFRHTHATWLSELGEPLKTAQVQLGHSDMATTLQVYMHAVPASQRNAVDRLEAILFPSVPNNEKGEAVEELGRPLPAVT